MFGSMQRDINCAFFNQLSRMEQTELLQELYDKGYSVPEISKKLGIGEQSLYKRINAHRGRGGAMQA